METKTLKIATVQTPLGAAQTIIIEQNGVYFGDADGFVLTDLEGYAHSLTTELMGGDLSRLWLQRLITAGYEIDVETRQVARYNASGYFFYELP